MNLFELNRGKEPSIICKEVKKKNKKTPNKYIRRNIMKNEIILFDNKDVYLSVEEKAANLLYLITKNHVFIDENKRIAATLFIYFLYFYNILYIDNKQVIDNNTLVVLIILIAESNPKEKDILIDLVMNILLLEKE